MTRNAMRICLIALIISGAFICTMFVVVSRSGEVDTTLPENTPEQLQTPLCFVVLDAGHGGYDRGASGTLTGTGEDELNLDVALKTADILSDMNIKCELTRRDNNALAPKKKDDMQERRRIMHESGADLTVSIHMNKFKDASVKGPMVFYTAGDEPSEQLSTAIMKHLCSCLEIPLRRTNTGDYYVIRNSNIPAVIVECGFLSNAEEEKLLCTQEYRQKLAFGIAEGIQEWAKSNSN